MNPYIVVFFFFLRFEAKIVFNICTSKNLHIGFKFSLKSYINEIQFTICKFILDTNNNTLI